MQKNTPQNPETIKTSQMQKTLISTCNNLKHNYFEFLSSLKFQNISDKIKYKFWSNKKQNEDDDEEEEDDYEHNMYKLYSFNFDEELMVENNGYKSFCKLIEDIQSLQQICNEVKIKRIIAQKDNQNRRRLMEVISEMEMISSEIPATLFKHSESQKKN